MACQRWWTRSSKIEKYFIVWTQSAISEFHVLATCCKMRLMHGNCRSPLRNPSWLIHWRDLRPYQSWSVFSCIGNISWWCLPCLKCLLLHPSCTLCWSYKCQIQCVQCLTPHVCHVVSGTSTYCPQTRLGSFRDFPCIHMTLSIEVVIVA